MKPFGADHSVSPAPLSRGLSLAGILAVSALAWGALCAAAAQESCEAPKPVCDARGAVFGISAFDPVGSAVRIGPDLLVTNRHIVADRETVQIILPDGGKREGQVVPTTFAGDMILIRADLPDGPALETGSELGGGLWTLGLDISARAVKAYPRGEVLRAPAEGKPYARLHHTAYSQPGNSGGALVNEKGKLMGVTASGGAGRFEAVPASQIAALKDMSGPSYADGSRALGKHVRECTLILEKAQRLRDTVPDPMVQVLKTSCTASDNRQLFDQAGQLLGRQRKFDDAIALFEKSLEKDPNAINTRLSLVITLRFARRLDDAAEHVRWLLDVVPQERAVHPIALAVGKASKDQALIDKALALIEKHAPNQLEAAKKFLESPVVR